MTATDLTVAHRPAKHASVFDRVLVGVDGTEAGFEACRQAAVLAPPEARIEAVSVVHLADAPRVADELQGKAEVAVDRAVEILGRRARKRLVNGFVAEALLHEVERVDATALVIGTHGRGRAAEILIGGVAGELLQEAPCSVLVARSPTEPAAFPSSIAVGIDGSLESDAALAAAQQLARRFDVPLRVLVACRGKGADIARAHLRAPLAERVEEHPVRALVEASGSAGIVVVGSRGLHGLRALGSVSERVAYQAASSVLVVRPAR